jgi:hypothetical protein
MSASGRLCCKSRVKETGPFGLLSGATALTPALTPALTLGFRVERSGRFSIAMFEAVFRAACTDAFKKKSLDVWPLTDAALAKLKSDAKFIEATKEGIGRATHVADRYARARELLAAR